MDIIRKIEQENMRMDMPAFRSGDTVIRFAMVKVAN